MKKLIKSLLSKEEPQKEQPKNESLVAEKTNQYPEIVQRIHSEFMTASELLLKEAKQILDKSESIPLEKVERLKKLGFWKAKEVTEHKKSIEQKESAEKLSKIIIDYSLRYPNNKFITEEQVKEICEKYNLVFGKITDYTGFIPEVKLNEIEKFKLKEEDYLNWYMIRSAWNGWVGTVNEILENNIDRLGHSESYILETLGKYTPERKVAGKLKICAPLKDFDMTGKELKGHKIVKQTPPDPVVLQEVPGGYLVVTAWGDEASDPIVLNQKFN